MPIYEFRCPFRHVTEKFMPISQSETTGVPCSTCGDKRSTDPSPGETGRLIFAERILSATPTSFRFADRSPNKK